MAGQHIASCCRGPSEPMHGLAPQSELCNRNQNQSCHDEDSSYRAYTSGTETYVQAMRWVSWVGVVVIGFRDLSTCWIEGRIGTQEIRRKQQA